MGRLRLWAATLADLFRTAPSEHWDILVRDLRFAWRTMGAKPAAHRDRGRHAGAGDWRQGGDVRGERHRPARARVSASYFEMIGVAPVIGRGFTEAEDRPREARRVAILSDALWRRRFAANPSVIGRPVSVGSQTHVVVGIMPRRFDDLVAGRLYEGAEMWFPLGYDPAAAFACRTCRHLRVLGRLAPGQTTDSAAREITGVMGRLAEEHPSRYHAPSVAVREISQNVSMTLALYPRSSAVSCLYRSARRS